jgi:hypothetical protein
VAARTINPDKLKVKKMETSSKASKAGRQLVSLLTAGAALAIATLVSASTSTQVKQLDPLVVPRTAHAATALADGRILITGGRDSAGNIVAVSEIFDPATNTSTASATLTTPRVDHTATLLPDGKVLVAGGTGASGSLSSAEIFDGSGFHVLAASMGAARAGHTATLLSNGTVLIAGGDAAGTAEIFDPGTETFSSTLLNLAAPRTGHTATLFSNDSVLLAGGNTDSMELFSAADQTFTLDSQMMSVVHIGQEAISLSDTRLLFVGGDATNTIEEFNRTADTVTVDSTMAAASSSATLLANGNILVLGAGMAGLYAPNAADPSSAFTAFDETSVPGSTALRRSGQTATQLSGDKKILVAGGVNAQNLFVNPALFNAARIWTDKDDYTPDEPVILSGSGWKASEDVYLYAVDTQTEAWTYGSTVTADGNSGFVVNPYFIVQLAQAGVSFHVTAVGAQSAMQADVAFTDSKPNTVTVGPPNSVSVAPGATANYAVTVNFNGNGNSCTSPLSISAGLPAGILPADVVFTPTSVTSTGGNVPATLAITTHAGTLPGSYIFTVLAANGGGTCQSGTATGTGVLVVTAPPAITSAPNTTFTVNSPGTFTVTATGVPAPTFTEIGALPSGVTLNPTTGVLSGTPALGTVGIYPITITASNGVLPNDIKGFTLTVQQATATVTLTQLSQNYNAQPKTVGVNTTPSGLSVSVTYDNFSTPPTNAGSYAVVATITDLNYTSTPATGTLVINKTNVSPNITVTPYHVTFDGNQHTATGTATGVGGENLSSSLNLIGTQHTDPGDYPTDPWTFSNPNYSATPSGTVHDIIDSACTSPSVTSTPTPQTVTYGAASASFTAAASGSPAPTVQWQVNSGLGFTNIGGGISTGIPGGTSSTLTINNPTVAMSGNQYRAVFSNSCDPATDTSSAATLTVNKKAISYTIGNDSHDYGSTANLAADLPATFLTGVNGENLSIAYSSTGNTVTSNVGTYDITGVVSNGTGLASNYTVALTNGVLTVNKKAISYTIGNASHEYGSTVNLATVLGTTFNTGVNGENLSIAYSSGGNTTTSNVGTYDITGVVSDGTGLLSNYTVALTNGVLTVTKATTTTEITQDTPDPSIVGQTYDVHWTVTPHYSGTPTGTVNVSDGTNSCSAAVSAGVCTLTSTTVGSKTLTATYSGDDNFLTSSDTEAHSVQYNFIGFLQPVDNLPMWNSVKAGQTIPVKWQLKDANGTLIGDLSTLAASGLQSIQVACPSGPAVVDAIEEVLTNAGSTVFRFDGTQFIYNWQTSKSWAGTCRMMTVTLTDGTKHYAQFTFTK